MAFVPTPNGLRLEAVYSQGGQVVENVFHYVVSPGLGETELFELGNAFYTKWALGLKLIQSESATLQKLVLTLLDTESSPGVEWTDELPQSGVVTGQPMPNSVTVAVRMVTALRGRSYRGRSYFIGLGESQVEGNTIPETVQNGIRNGYLALLNISYGAIQANMAVLSKVHSLATRTQGVLTPVTNITVNGVIDSQRRRLPQRGR